MDNGMTTPGHRVVVATADYERQFAFLDELFSGGPFDSGLLNIICYFVLGFLVVASAFVCYCCWTARCSPPAAANRAADEPPVAPAAGDSMAHLLQATSSNTVHKE
ncbi:hypothetical protein PMAYCL1PPCAC_08254 [Pristionchus mayeri]|uniref:Uncharacterized protein n=1 Tax=Pristionchus mayeri TaxID=1317129 RepID=A0AAN5C5E4_9BILA|nr:hypothetical protein PMAYCL1PPCAC_08252 [Pristionchus mayeri]GMR38058.1 hypothetical protein PMAYCL1PPCAC_08253 [Pristionchus mayeri]GMR38059.1 hypothetical protein PMAYCL1PPCAC_08254 [Pristionchus mayeri]